MMIYFILIAVGFILTTVYWNYYVGIEGIPDHVVIGMKIVRVVDVDKDNLFHTMADIENYPKVLDNFVSVKKINQTDAEVATIIVAEETVSEAGITTTLIVKHILVPTDKYQVEILSGDAKETFITVTLKEIDSGTEITTDAQLHLRGLLGSFGILPRSQIEHAMNTVIEEFVEYTKTQYAEGLF